MAQATTFNIASNREDVLQGFTMVEPQATPLLSMLKKGRAPKASYTEWVVDDLSDPSLAVVEEGSDVTSFANPGENRARIGNHVERQQRSWSVSDLEVEVDDAAVMNQVAAAKSKKLIELRRDMASTIGSDQANQAGGGGGGAAKCRGLGQWILNSAQASNPVPAGYRTPAASINTTAAASFAESDVNGVLESIYSQTGTLDNFKLFAGTSLKKEFSDFSRVGSANGVYRANEDISTNKVTKNVMRYEGDFGTLDIITDLFLAKDGSAASQGMRGYVINPDLVELAFVDGPSHYDLEDQGGGPRGFYKAWYTLRVKNPLGLGKFAATA
jgi:hypothetical protein